MPLLFLLSAIAMMTLLPLLSCHYADAAIAAAAAAAMLDAIMPP